jgi:hypothetical protein
MNLYIEANASETSQKTPSLPEKSRLPFVLYTREQINRDKKMQFPSTSRI